jgi:hypothetical protein
LILRNPIPATAAALLIAMSGVALSGMALSGVAAAQGTTGKAKSGGEPDPDASSATGGGARGGGKLEGVSGERGPVTDAKGAWDRVEALEAFDVIVSTRPRRLGPGQSGVLSLTLMLGDEPVILPGAKIELKITAESKLVGLGAFAVTPATVGVTATVFRGQLVHEDILVLQVPVSIDANTPHGRHPVKGEVAVEARSGKTGAPLGLLFQAIDGFVVVGKPLPSMRPRPGRAASRGVTARRNLLPTPSVPASTSSTTASPDRESSVPAGRSGRPTQPEGGGPFATTSAADASAATEPEADEGRTPWLYAVVLGGLAVLGVFWIRRRRA